MTAFAKMKEALALERVRYMLLLLAYCLPIAVTVWVGPFVNPASWGADLRVFTALGVFLLFLFVLCLSKILKVDVFINFKTCTFKRSLLFLESITLFVLVVGVFLAVTGSVRFYAGEIDFRNLTITALWLFARAAGEELLFRSVLLGVLSSLFGPVLGVVFQAALFACIHHLPDAATFVWYFCSGILFALVVRSTGALWLAVVLHWVWNLIVYLVSGIQGAAYGSLGFFIVMPNYNGWLFRLSAIMAMVAVLYTIKRKQ